VADHPGVPRARAGGDDHETTAFPAVTALFKLFGLKSHAYWRPVDSIKDISEAEKELAGLAAK